MPIKPMLRSLELDRRFIVVDLENIVGGAVLSRDAASWAREQILESIGIRESDHVVIATAHNGIVNSGCAWPAARLVPRSGESGADLALLEVLDEDIEQRFAEVIVVSGDGIFAEAVAKLGGQNVKTTVVGVVGCTASTLRLAAHETKLLPQRYNEITPKEAA